MVKFLQDTVVDPVDTEVHTRTHTLNDLLYRTVSLNIRRLHHKPTVMTLFVAAVVRLPETRPGQRD